jgi:polyphosphate kinase 2 (PPK2 family)
MKYGSLIKRFRIENPKRINLADHDPGETAGFEKEEAESIAVAHTRRMTDLQQRLYAEHNWALLIILQGVDAAGKDSAIKRVMAGLNPQGCVVHPFKVPTAEELDQDFYGGRSSACPPAATSAFSTVLTTRKCWWCASTRSC